MRMGLPFPFPREMLSIWYPLSLGMSHMTSPTNMQMVVCVTTSRTDVICQDVIVAQQKAFTSLCFHQN